MSEKSLLNPYDNATQYFNNGNVTADCIKVRLVEENTDGSIGGDIYANTGSNDAALSGLTGLVAQSYQVAMQRGIQHVWELGSAAYYVIDGKPAGQGTITNLWGPDKTTVEFWTKFGDICNPTSLIIENQKCQCDKTVTIYDKRLRFQGGYLQGFQMSGQAANFVHTAAMQFIYVDLKISKP